MHTDAQNPAPRIGRGLRLVFFISGASALIDQIVWTRSLHRVFGVTAPAAGTVLAAFMGGLAIGGYLFGRLADRVFFNVSGRENSPPYVPQHGLKSALFFYAAMEFAIAMFAPLSPWLFRALEPAYAAMAGVVGLGSAWLAPCRGALCLAVLLPPTILMGGTLPVLASGFLRDRPGRAVAALYSINTWGAVFGCFLAGYVLLAMLGETRSLFLAAGGNVVAAAWAFSIARNSASRDRRQVETADPARQTRSALAGGNASTRVILFASFINGFGALALEVLWGRTVALFTDASVYAFSCIIGTFLIGIALGSRVAGTFADRLRRPHGVLAAMIISMGLLLALSLRMFTANVSPGALGGTVFMDYARAIWFPLRTIQLAAGLILPVTLLSGMCFPLFAVGALRGGSDGGRRLGTMYAVNTIGGILGALLASFVMLPLLGDRGSFFFVAAAYIASGVACAVATGRRGLAVVAGAAAVGALVFVFPPRGSLARDIIAQAGTIARHEETPEGTVTAITFASGKKHLLVNGTGMTELCTDTKLMAHLPLALHENPKNVLVICFGMGTCFRSAVSHGLPVTAVELQPAVPRMFDFYYADAAAVLAQGDVVIADGRNFLLTTSKKYSVITIDPAPPMYSAGTVNLYTREFFQLCHSHFDDGGIMCLWIPDNCSLESDARLIMKTFRSVFPHCNVWHGPDRLGYYLIGSASPLALSAARLQADAASPRVMRDLGEFRPELPGEWPRISENRLMDEAALDRYVASEPRTLTDDRPYSEFPWLAWIRLGEKLPGEWMRFERFEREARR